MKFPGRVGEVGISISHARTYLGLTCFRVADYLPVVTREGFSVRGWVLGAEHGQK